MKRASVVVSAVTLLKRIFPNRPRYPESMYETLPRAPKPPRDPALPYKGERDCGDCMTMSHCETHHKIEGTYPFDDDLPRDDEEQC